MKDRKLRKCPECKKLKLERIIDSAPMGFVRLAYSEVKTLGHLADRNSDKMSDDEKGMLKHKHKTKKQDVLSEKGFNVVKPKKQKPHFVDDGVDLNKLGTATPQQKADYIKKGIHPK